MPPEQAKQAPSVTDVFAQRLRSVRERKGWTQQRVAARLGELGTRIDRASLAKIETGRRKVSLNEAVAIAAALGTSPAVLFLPIESRSMVRLTGQLEVRTSRARAWFTNQAPLEPGDPTVFIEVAEEETRSLRALRKEVRALLAGLPRLEQRQDP
jgi:transcriptional regulator with XRE-family HTH domain